MARKIEAITEVGLNLKQEQFCQLFVKPENDFFGNGVASYLEVYDIDKSKPNWYKTACAAASQLLSNIKVCKRINELLETSGFNDQNVDKQHLFLLNQFADYKTKLGAIREYNALKKRVENKIEINLPTPIYGGQSKKI